MKVIEKGKTRKRLAVPGDLFGIHVVDIGWLFSLVVDDKARLGDDWIDLFIIYIFAEVSPSITSVPVLDKRRLLFNPIATNPTPWRSGHFQFISNIPLTTQNTWQRHCFYHPWWNKYYDERGVEIQGKFLPCSVRAMSNVKSIEYNIGCHFNLIPLDDR